MDVKEEIKIYSFQRVGDDLRPTSVDLPKNSGVNDGMSQRRVPGTSTSLVFDFASPLSLFLSPFITKSFSSPSHAYQVRSFAVSGVLSKTSVTTMFASRIKQQVTAHHTE